MAEVLDRKTLGMSESHHHPADGADLAWFRHYDQSVRWRFARTYVESYPHEYTLAKWGDDEDAFWKAVECIERWGVWEPFWRARRKYLYVGDRKYWHMGDMSSEDPGKRPTLINRTWLDVTRYRDEALALGFEEESLDPLAEGWKMLLARARGEAAGGG
jgi:hypothetical protein